MFLLKPNFCIIELPQYTVSESSHEWVLAEFCRTQWKSRVSSRRRCDVRMGRENGFVLSLVDGGGRQEAGVNADWNLVHDPAGVSQVVGRVL